MATKAKSSKQDDVQTVRIAILGPTYTGKTQIINRIVNNNFYTHYTATEEVEVFKIFHNRAQRQAKPDFVMIELLDCFPQDHPLLFSDSVDNDEAKKMREDLQKIVENKPEDEQSDKKWIDAFIFVYDAS